MDGIPAEFQGMLTQAGLGHFQRLIDRAAISSEELAQLTVSIDDPPDDGPINPVASSSATVNNEQSVPVRDLAAISDVPLT